MNKNKIQHTQIIFFALLTSVITALANLLIKNWFDFNVFSLMFWFVLPIGAFLVGMGGASGGFLACKYFHIKPDRLDAIALAAVAALTMYLIYYLDYTTFVLESGNRVADYIDFTTYLDVIVTKSHSSVGHMRGGKWQDMGEVGGFGYFLLVIKFVGVLLGGWALFITLESLAMCKKCNLYYKKIASKNTFHESINDLNLIYNKLNSDLISEYKEALQITAKGDCKAKIKFTLMRCPKCKEEYVAEEFFVRKEKGDYHEVQDLNNRKTIPRSTDIEMYFHK
ncbi:MAG: hypothetical protein RLN62_02515 [Rickettsiales bacterium]